MPEAVIVATARTPIGRANKGSLVDCRPDDLSATIVKALLDKVPALDPATIEDVIWGYAQPAGEAGYNLARVVAHPRRAPARARARRSTGTARRRCRRSAWPRTRSGPARATCSSPAASRPSAASRTACPTACPARTTRRSPRPRSAPTKRNEGGQGDVDAVERPARRLHRHGPDGRERRRVRARDARGDGRVRRRCRRTAPSTRRRTASSSARSRRSRSPTARSSPRTTARGPTRRSRSSRRSSRCSGPTARSPRATRAR